MKKLIVLFLAVSATFSVKAQIICSIEMSKTAYNNTGDSLYHIANDFADSVTVLLKNHYPARVSKTSVKLDFDQKTKLFTLKYSAEIERCTHGHDLYFKRVGALSVNKSLSAAQKEALVRVKEQEVEQKEKFHGKHGNYGEAGNGGYLSDSVENGKGFWVIYEKFIVAR